MNTNLQLGRIQVNGRTVDIDSPESMAHGNILDVMNEARMVNAPIEGIPTYREFAKSFRLPDGPMVGQTYDPSRDPVHDCVVERLDSGKYQRMVWAGAVQTGKSLLLTLAMARSFTFGCEPVVYSQPTRPKIHEAWNGKILPILESSNLHEWIPRRGQGSKGGQSPLFFLFTRPNTGVRAGILYFIPGGGKSEAAQASVTAPNVLVDEVDSFPSRHRIELIAKRADAYGSKAVRIYTSTIKHDHESIMLNLYEDSTQSRLAYACPHCGGWQTLEWENVRYSADSERVVCDTAKYYCTHCAAGWNESDRIRALSKWKEVTVGQTIDRDGSPSGSPSDSMTWGLIWTALDTTIRGLPQTALEHFRAQKALERGDHGPMRSFVRDQLCRMYTGEMEEMETAGPLTWEYLMNRSISSPFGPVVQESDRSPETPDQYLFSRHIATPPQEAKWSVAAVDVQHNRLYWVVRAFDTKATSWIYAWGYEYMRQDRAAADEAEIRATLDRVHMLFQRICGETDLVLIGLDVGDRTELLRDWTASASPIWRCMKGGISNMTTRPGDLDGLAWMRDGILQFQSDNARDLFHATFRRPVSSEGTTLFPFGVGRQNVTVFRHMVSEQSGIDPKTKRRIIVYGPGRNDYLDAGKMTQVLMMGYLVLHRNFTRKEVEQLSAPKPSNVVSDPDAPNVHHDPPPERGDIDVGEGPVRIGGPIQQSRELERAHNPIPGGRIRGFRPRGRW